MSYGAIRCLTGERVRAGDRVRWAARPGHVEFVLGPGGVADGPADPLDWFVAEFGTGFMLEVEGAGAVFEHTADEDLEFVGRGPP